MGSGLLRLFDCCQALLPLKFLAALANTRLRKRAARLAAVLALSCFLSSKPSAEILGTPLGICLTRKSANVPRVSMPVTFFIQLGKYLDIITFE